MFSGSHKMGNQFIFKAMCSACWDKHLLVAVDTCKNYVLTCYIKQNIAVQTGYLI